jgi:hypothetical protein
MSGDVFRLSSASYSCVSPPLQSAKTNEANLFLVARSVISCHPQIQYIIFEHLAVTRAHQALKVKQDERFMMAAAAVWRRTSTQKLLGFKLKSRHSLFCKLVYPALSPPIYVCIICDLCETHALRAWFSRIPVSVSFIHGVVSSSITIFLS